MHPRTRPRWAKTEFGAHPVSPCEIKTVGFKGTQFDVLFEPVSRATVSTIRMIHQDRLSNWRVC
jgi:hypothetical protein